MMPEPINSTDPAPKVDGTIGNAGVGIGWGVKQIAMSLAGDGGIRLLALTAVASFTWVATWSITRYTEMQGATDALLVRTGNEGIEREKADRARNEKEMRDWMSNELDKQRTAKSADIQLILKETQIEREKDRSSFANEQEKNRSLILKLAGAKIVDDGTIP